MTISVLFEKTLPKRWSDEKEPRGRLEHILTGSLV